jgi:hypothetical protein
MSMPNLGINANIKKSNRGDSQKKVAILLTPGIETIIGRPEFLGVDNYITH